MFLLAAATHTATSVLAQRQIGPKSNEIPSFAPLLAGLELSGVVLTMDGLHTQRAHARFLVEVKRAHFVMIAKDNQPRLFDALDALAWKEVTIGHRSQETGHGRHEVRTIQVRDAPDDLDVIFPHVKQVFLVERHVTRRVRCRRRGSGKFYTKVVKTAIAVLGITSLTAGQANPAQLAALVRGHWSIEAMHFVRDVTFREDASTIATGSRPRLMATLRNISIGLIRQSGTRRWRGSRVRCRSQVAGCASVSASQGVGPRTRAASCRWSIMKAIRSTTDPRSILIFRVFTVSGERLTEERLAGSRAQRRNAAAKTPIREASWIIAAGSGRVSSQRAKCRREELRWLVKVVQVSVPDSSSIAMCHFRALLIQGSRASAGEQPTDRAGSRSRSGGA
ncbi:ISAs1 family transposase [Nonomuraea sp. NPDC002799]